MHKVLFIDDEERVLHSLKLSLHKENFKGVFTTNVFDGIKMLKEDDISVVVSDHKMPHLSGVDALSVARKVSPYTIRILLTGECDQDCTINSINKAHIFQYLQKPIETESFKLILKKAIRYHEESKLIADVKKGNINLVQAIQRFTLNTLQVVKKRLATFELKPGMTLAEDLITDNGLMIVKKGRILTLRDLSLINKYQFSRGVLILP